MTEFLNAMTAYIVLTPPHADPHGDDALFVRDGFTWFALVVPMLWFAFHRMWIWAAGFLLVPLALLFASHYTGWHGTALVLAIAVNLLAGFEAGAWRAGALRHRGWEEADVVVAPDRTAAEAIHFADAVSADRPEPPMPEMNAGPASPQVSGGPALGLFDHGDR